MLAHALRAFVPAVNAFNNVLPCGVIVLENPVNGGEELQPAGRFETALAARYAVRKEN